MTKIAVVIPCYKVGKHIQNVLDRIGPEVDAIYLIDDCCPDYQYRGFINDNFPPRTKIVRNQENLGVGGAVKVGYLAAIADEMDIIVKVDGDGQMDPKIIMEFVRPIIDGKADYTKGNRFFDLAGIKSMPVIRLFGNSLLSFMTKISSGYWDIFDPTNGYTAIHRDALRKIPFDKVSDRYFFETDMLFRLNIMKAVVIDIPMESLYGSEKSNLKIRKILFEFLFKHKKNFIKRIFYNYYLRDMSLASVELPLGMASLSFGLVYGGYHWFINSQVDALTPVGTVVISAIAILFGLQLILAFLAYDIASVPRRVIHRDN